MYFIFSTEQKIWSLFCVDFCDVFSAFSPEKKNGKRGFNLMVINGQLYL